MATWRELFERRYHEVRSSDEGRQLAADMLALVEQTDEPTARYVLLTLIGNVASEAGEVSLALQAVERLAKEFEVQDHVLRSQVILRAAKSGMADDDELATAAGKCAADALHIDDYDIAKQMIGVASAVVRRTDAQMPRQWLTLKRSIDSGQRAFSQVSRALRALEERPDDPAANGIVGKYYCFVKSQWQRGLPFLTKCADPQLAAVAGVDLANPSLAEERAALADQWWKVGEQQEDYGRECQLRAVYWYLMVLEQTRTGLAAVKADVRVREAERLHGREDVDAIRNQFHDTPG
jgi:hypothetical protein